MLENGTKINMIVPQLRKLVIVNKSMWCTKHILIVGLYNTILFFFGGGAISFKNCILLLQSELLVNSPSLT